MLQALALRQQRFDQVDGNFAAAEGAEDRSLGDCRDTHRGHLTTNGGFNAGLDTGSTLP